jgi:hypothetical protein
VLSATEVAAVLSKVLDRPIAFHPITFEEQRQAMIDAGLSETVAQDNAKAVTLMAEGDCDYVTDDVPSLLGRPAASNSSPPITPRRSRKAQVTAAAVTAASARVDSKNP